MRSLSQVEFDNKQLEVAAKSVITAIGELLDLESSIQKNKSVSDSTASELGELSNRKKVYENLKNDSDPEFVVDNLLNARAFAFPRALKDDKCPNCNSVFPSDLWSWHGELYCPYCGQKVIENQGDYPIDFHNLLD